MRQITTLVGRVRGRAPGSEAEKVPAEDRAGWPFLPLVPAIIVIVGIATAAAITHQGVRQLKAQSDQATADKTRMLALTLGERLRATPHSALNKHPLAAKRYPIGRLIRETPDPSFNRVIHNAAERSGAEFMLVDDDNGIVVNETDGSTAQHSVAVLKKLTHGDLSTSEGRLHFHATPLSAPLDGLWLIAFVSSAETPFATSPLVRHVTLFTLILVSVAAFVAYYLARSVHSDVSYVRDRIVAMTHLDSAPAGQPIVVRGVDQVGQLTVAFNKLVERFYSAEDAYRRDLSGALSYERERSDFLAALSHELRTPLNAILGFADVLLSEVDGPLSEEAKENLTVVHQAGDHLRSLINDILDLSAIETGRLNLQLKETNLLTVAEDVVRETRLSAQSKGLHIDVSGEPVAAVADQLRVRQVLGNLVSNAVKFTNQGEVNVHVERRGEEAALSVADTGPGIAMEDQAAVFEEYRQSGDWQARGAGAGLGLAITRRLVRMHGGRIELKSSLGEGAQFTVLLPVSGPDTSGSGARDELDSPRGNTLRINSELARSMEREA